MSSTTASPATPKRGESWPSAWSYFGLVYVWSWGFWVAAAATGQGVGTLPTLVLFALGGIGPIVSASVLSTRGGGAAARRALYRSAISFRHIPGRWWVVIVLVAVAPNLLGLLVEAALSGRSPDFDELTTLSKTPSAFGLIVLFALVTGFVEEPGWRGYALERLRARHTLLVTSLIIGVLWAIWHFPLYFVEETFQNERGFGSEAFWFLTLSIVALSVLYTWIQRGAGWVVAAAVAFHALGNTTGEYFPVSGGARWITFGIILGLAVVVAERWRLTRARAQLDPQRALPGDWA